MPTATLPCICTVLQLEPKRILIITRWIVLSRNHRRLQAASEKTESPEIPPRPPLQRYLITNVFSASQELHPAYPVIGTSVNRRATDAAVRLSTKNTPARCLIHLPISALREQPHRLVCLSLPTPRYLVAARWRNTIRTRPAECRPCRPRTPCRSTTGGLGCLECQMTRSRVALATPYPTA